MQNIRSFNCPKALHTIKRQFANLYNTYRLIKKKNFKHTLEKSLEVDFCFLVQNISRDRVAFARKKTQSFREGSINDVA